MLKKPKVSIIIPAHNEEKFLAEAVGSALSQTFHNFEIIIVNDASRDNTKKIAKELVKINKNIRLYNHSKNKYRAGALNTGIKYARGKYICFLDGDDIYVKTKLEKQFDFMEKNPKIDMIYSNFKTIDRAGAIRTREAINLERDPKEIMIEFAQRGEIKGLPSHRILAGDDGVGRIIPSCSPMIRKNVFKKIKFDEKLRTSQDYDMWFQIIGKGFKIAKLPIVAYYYRHHPGQITATKTQEEKIQAYNYIANKLITGVYFK